MPRRSWRSLGLIRLLLGCGVVALVAEVGVGFALNGAAASVRSPSTAAVQRLLWHGCAAPEPEKFFQCATVKVPLDYRNPAGPTIRLAVIRIRASGPGPAFSSSWPPSSRGQGR